MMDSFTLRKAKNTDVDTVVQLYRSVVGQEHCVWDEAYPTRENAETDCRNGGLYVAEDTEGSVIASLSIEHEPELSALPFWNCPFEQAAEIARVVVAPALQGKGLAAGMLKRLFPQLRNEGYTSVRLLVSTENPAAMKTYQKLGFTFLTRCREYDLDFFACELSLQ